MIVTLSLSRHLWDLKLPWKKLLLLKWLRYSAMKEALATFICWLNMGEVLLLMSSSNFLDKEWMFWWYSLQVFLAVLRISWLWHTHITLLSALFCAVTSAVDIEFLSYLLSRYSYIFECSISFFALAIDISEMVSTKCVPASFHSSSIQGRQIMFLWIGWLSWLQELWQAVLWVILIVSKVPSHGATMQFRLDWRERPGNILIS